MLKHDSSGFLSGEPIDPIELATAIDIWEKIRDDIASIKGMISGQSVEVGNQSQAAAPSAQGDKGGKPDPQKISVTVVNKPGQVAANSSFSGDARSLEFGAIRPSREDQGVAAPIRRVGRDNEVAPDANSLAVATPSAQGAARDSSGRFVKKGSNEGGRDASGRFVKKGSGNDGAEGIASSFSEASAAKKVGQAVAEATRGTDDMDPTIKAFNEVLTPITGVAGTLSGLGGNKDPERRSWFRRIFGELKSFRREETAYSKASARSLKGIERRPREGGGLMSMLASLLTRMPLIGGLMAGGGIMAGGGALGGLLGGAMKGGKGLLKRIPILGALLSSAGGLFDIFSSETDDNLTRGEKDKKTGKGAGGIAGTLGGMWAGAKMGAAVGALGGPIGAAIGGVVGGAAGMFFGEKAGAVIGETVGGWVADLREADIAGYSRDKWDQVTTGIGSALDSTTAFFFETWDGTTKGISSAWGRSIDFLGNKITEIMTGIFGEKWAGIADSISQKWDSVTDAMGSKWDSITEGFSDKWNDVTEGVKGFFKRAGEGAKNALSGANEYVRETTGVDIKKNIDAAVDSTKKTTSEAIDSIKKNANAVSNTVKGFFGFGSDGASDAVSGAGGASGGAGASASFESSGPLNRKGANESAGAKLSKGYRGRHRFDGISGGSNLSKMGTYTEAEAQRIRELKSSGANTGANVKGGMPADIQQKIRASAEAHGLDAEMMLAIAAMESGGNKNAISSTGASGIYQFTGGTATGVGIKDRFDVDQNIDGGMRLTKENAAFLESRGLPVTPENIYMAHQLGPVAAADLIAGAGSGKRVGELNQSTQRGMNLNYGSKSSTASEYLAKNREALAARYESVVANSDAGLLKQSPVEVASGGPMASQDPVGRKEPVVTLADIAASHSPALAMNMPAVASPTMPAPQAVPPAPTTQSPLGSTGKKDQQTVTVEAPEAGQDVRDRSIAHIVTGGIST